MATLVGMTFITRKMILLNQGFSLVPRKPSSIDCPARTPTVEDDNPEKSSVNAKTTLANNPKRGVSVLYASSTVATVSPAV